MASTEVEALRVDCSISVAATATASLPCAALVELRVISAVALACSSTAALIPIEVSAILEIVTLI